MKKLTKKQVEIMKIFWASEHPLAASDILKLDESMNINTIRASIQSLLKADYIEVAGIEHRGNVLARTYTSKIKIEEYIISNFAGINNKISKKSLVAQFIKNEEDEEVINELEQELKHRKEILAEKEGQLDMIFPTYGSVFACILLSSVFMIVVCLLGNRINFIFKK